MKRPRILLVGPFPPTTGGVTTFMLNLMGSSLAADYEFVPFTTSRPPKKNVINNYGYGAIFRGGLWRFFLGLVVTAYHFLVFPFVVTGRRIAIVQIQSSDFQTFWESSLYLLIAKALGRPTLMRFGGVFDHFYESSSPCVRRLIEAVIARPDIVITQSAYWRRYFSRLGREDGVIVLNNSVPCASLHERSASEPDGGNNLPVCLFIVGTEAIRKGIDTLIDAMQDPALRKVALRYRFLAVPPVLQERLRDLAVGQQVECLGYLDHEQVLEEFRRGDIFLLPSLGEGFPNSLLEAMAAALPVIVTPVGAVPEIVRNGDGGFVVPVGDATLLAEAIATLANDSGLRRRMGQRNQQIIREHFLADVVFPRLTASYEKLLRRA